MEACVGAHHLSRKLQALGHDARLMPANFHSHVIRTALGAGTNRSPMGQSSRNQ
jgi:transposase